jgi:UDP-2,4-diacetamido-2,4,6-trideoxy-beta-L-altropyranose hydrolase
MSLGAAQPPLPNAAPVLFIRADASQQMGSGHVMRCLALAEAWAARGHAVYFICRPLLGNLTGELQQRGWPVHSLPLPELEPTWSEADQDADAAATAALVAQLSSASDASWLLVDHYQLDARWHARVTQPGLHIAVLDDLANRPLQADVLIDQNALAHLHHRYPALTPPHCVHLLGAGYTLLRQDVQAAALRRASGITNTVPIFLGGADTERWTEAVLAQWVRQPARADLHAHVLCGAMNPHWRDVAAACEAAHIEFSMAVRGLDDVMARSRAAIVACGMLAVELQALEVPSLLVPLSSIQRAVAHDFAQRGRAVVLETSGLQQPHTFDQAWAATLALNHHSTGRAFMALDGAQRVVDTLLEIAA